MLLRVWPELPLYVTVLSRAGQAAADDDAGAGGGEDKLSKLRICPQCGGLGMMKEFYNHMVISKTCSMCDGEALIAKPGYESLLESAVAAKGAAAAAAMDPDAVDDEDVPGDLPPLEDC